MKPLTILVTGASRGFGAAIVQQLLAADDRVMANARSVSGLAALGAHPRLASRAGDVRDRIHLLRPPHCRTCGPTRSC